MERLSLEPGHQYGWRENHRQRGSPIHRIEIIQKVRPGKWKVRFLEDPHPGLVDYVRSGNIVTTWAEHEAFLADEARLMKVIEATNAIWDGTQDDPRIQAVNAVLESTGEVGDWCFKDMGPTAGQAELSLNGTRRVIAKTDLDPDPFALDPLAYTDRHGVFHLSLSGAIKLAQGFAAAESGLVALHVNAAQKKWTEEARKDDITLELFRKWRVGWALALEWAKTASEERSRATPLDQIRERVETNLNLLWTRLAEIDNYRAEEIRTLRTLVEQAAVDLRSLGAVEKAEFLLKAITPKEEKGRPKAGRLSTSGGEPRPTTPDH
ncbi:MAG TPA: hypothetical protein VGV60_11180 [Candidatus Polarisedimenticolia bacterium]|nr:hypothetical protein [Nitrospirales bacterium]HEV8701822.1 hypothetical protein [Candidatus Polarisedimenticolia bacterium]